MTLVLETEKDDVLDLAANIASLWKKRDNAAATKWVESLPPGRARTKLEKELKRTDK